MVDSQLSVVIWDRTFPFAMVKLSCLVKVDIAYLLLLNSQLSQEIICVIFSGHSF